MKHVVIIGNGIAGTTTARHLRKKSDCRITLISDEHPYFFSRTALMYVYMGHMRFEDTQPYENWFWKKNRIDLIQSRVIKVNTAKKEILLQDITRIRYDDLVIATGSKPRILPVPGNHLKGIQGFYFKKDLETLEMDTISLLKQEKKAKRVVVIGGGLIGIELVEMMYSRNIPVTFIVRDALFFGKTLSEKESNLLTKHIQSHSGIDLRLDTNLLEILSEHNSEKVSAIKVQFQDQKPEVISCDLVLSAIGVQPNIDFLNSSKIEVSKGVLVDNYLQTNIQNVYAIGDCAELKNPDPFRNSIEAVWYTARIMGETLANTIANNFAMKYTPGYWFNSAKFFDIEYQTYGNISAKIQGDESRFYWEDNSQMRSLQLNFSKIDKRVLGVNVLGIRMRQEVFEKWFKQNRKIEYVIEHLQDANFDAEFSKGFEEEVVSYYNKKYNTSLKSRKRSWKRIFSKF